MYNFKMTKAKQKEILDNCNFNEEESFIFNNLVEGKSRRTLEKMFFDKYGYASATFNRRVKDIVKIIRSYEDGDKFTHKVYMHTFPNGKKYVGVCKCCEDRWNNGNGYANNPKMYEDILKYGWDKIEHKVIVELTDSSLAYIVEKVLIQELDLIKNGYNNM